MNEVTSAMLGLIAELRTALAGADYLCLSALGDTRLQVRFIGQYQQREVVWDAELIALGATEAHSTQFIEIGTASTQGIPIKIGLQVPCIDQPTLLKAIIMVRSYKRLHPGRHEFGPVGRAAQMR